MKTENIEQYIQRTHTRQTARTYLFTIENFMAVHPKAKNYQYKDIVNYFVELKSRYPNPSTRNAMLAALKRYYDYLVDTKQRNDHPCRWFRIKGENIAKRTQMQFQDLFTPKELEALLNREVRYENLKLRNKIIISLLIYQALTCDEIMRLDVHNVDLDNCTIYIKGSAKQSSRTLELQRVQKEYIEEYLRHHRDKLSKTQTKRLLIGIRGDPETVDGIGGMLEPLKALYPERNLNAKTMRQSVIANWLNKDKLPLEQVQTMAGHKWPSSTLRYRREDIHEQREKINKWHPLK